MESFECKSLKGRREGIELALSIAVLCAGSCITWLICNQSSYSPVSPLERQHGQCLLYWDKRFFTFKGDFRHLWEVIFKRKYCHYRPIPFISLILPSSLPSSLLSLLSLLFLPLNFLLLLLCFPPLCYLSLSPLYPEVLGNSSLRCTPEIPIHSSTASLFLFFPTHLHALPGYHPCFLLGKLRKIWWVQEVTYGCGAKICVSWCAELTFSSPVRSRGKQFVFKKSVLSFTHTHT